jgi:hypothetical protein
MRVRVVFEFNETQLRTIRASYKRGGKATRKESSIFINRAVTTALDAAPEPAPARRKVVKPPPPPPPPVLTEAEERDAERGKLANIRKLYRHGKVGAA